jgi:cell division protein FtsW
MIILMIVVCGLIAVNNAITAATVAVIIMGIMFIAGLHLGFFGGIAGLGAAGFALLILTDTKGYRLQRVTSFLDPFADAQNTGFQVVQGLLALGSGGLFGVGLGKSMQKTLYLPEPQNDFIYAIIGEELGFIGLLVLLAVYLLLIWRCVHISMNAPDTFGMLLGSGITIMLAVQVILNVMVVTSLMPPTGIILPFVSWGGNALLIFMGCMGIMLNISRHIPK